jgi:IMP-specific 5'-nucleotidase
LYALTTSANWDEKDITALLDVAEASVKDSLNDQKMRGTVIRKKRSIGLVPESGQQISREALDETVLRAQVELQRMNKGAGPKIPFCAFNGGRDVWVDVGNKVGLLDGKDFLSWQSNIENSIFCLSCCCCCYYSEWVWRFSEHT